MVISTHFKKWSLMWSPLKGPCRCHTHQWAPHALAITAMTLSKGGSSHSPHTQPFLTQYCKAFNWVDVEVGQFTVLIAVFQSYATFLTIKLYFQALFPSLLPKLKAWKLFCNSRVCDKCLWSCIKTDSSVWNMGRRAKAWITEIHGKFPIVVNKQCQNW